MPETEYELPRMDDFVFSGDGWMQCRICRETWNPVSLQEAVYRWNDHICREKRSK